MDQKSDCTEQEPISGSFRVPEVDEPDPRPSPIPVNPPPDQPFQVLNPGDSRG